MREIEKLNEIADALIKAVTAAGPDRGLLGTRAAEIVRAAQPDFSPSEYGARSLRELVQRDIPQIVIIGSSGADMR